MQSTDMSALTRGDMQDVRVDMHEGLPALIQPWRSDATPAWSAAWMTANRDAIERALAIHGALSFRGFGLQTSEDFGNFVAVFPPPSNGYAGGVSPRKGVTGNVMEATHAPSDRVIKLHQEMAYARDYPLKLAFFCEKAPLEGGETTIGDMREVTRRMSPAFLQELSERGILYRRFFRNADWLPGHPKLDITHRTWNDAFGTDDRDEAEARCIQSGSTCEWIENGMLASYRADAVLDHPVTGEQVLFNGFTGFHLNRLNLGDSLFQLFEEHYGADRRRPYEVTYGDGAPIDLDSIYALYPLLEDVTAYPPWHPGDVMLLDNILTAHGRSSFKGDRLVRVTLLN